MAEQRSPSDHQFGSQSTDLKLSMVEGYLRGFTTALRQKFGTLIYIDAFAGTGIRTIRRDAQPADWLSEGEPARIERRRGSAQIALDIVPRFDELVFIDAKPAHYRALCALRDANADRRITALQGDANEQIVQVLSGRRWANARGVIFLDPYGMAVDWAALEAIRRTGALDVWYLVSLEGLYRQAPRDRHKLDASKRDAITKMVGASDWEERWYADKPKEGLFNLFEDDETAQFGGEPNMRRTAEIEDISAYFKERLDALFPKVLEPMVLRNNAGARTFLLFFAMANSTPAAIGVATRIANHILKAGRSSQSLPR
jgi:three-Cys-motif partner protein